MFTDFYATNTVAASELRASDRLTIWEDDYTITAYSVPTPGMIKLWLSPERKADGSLPFNPLETITVHRNYQFQPAN